MNSRLEPSHIYFGNSFRRWRKRWTASKDDFIGNDNLFWIKIENALVICECLKIRNGKYWKWPKAHSWVCALRWITTTLDGCVNVVCWAHNCDMPGLIERVVVYCRLRITKLKHKKNQTKRITNWFKTIEIADSRSISLICHRVINIENLWSI